MGREHAVRFVLLCEDRAHEDFVRGRFPQPSFRMMYVVRGPNQAGVLAQYPAEVRVLRAKKNQALLGLVVMIDGDNAGPTSRHESLDQALRKAQAADPKHRGPRAPDDPIALLVPTRNVETWIVGLLEGPQAINESDDYKGHRACSAAKAAESAGARLRALDLTSVEARALLSKLPALVTAHQEIQRLPPL